MPIRPKNRVASYAVIDGHLVRTVAFPAGDGKPYQHRCEKAAYEAVAHAISETPAQGQGTTLLDIRRQEKLPFTQANVALEFLKERGLVEVRHRRCYPASTDVYLDAMVEYLALEHRGATGESTSVSESG